MVMHVNIKVAKHSQNKCDQCKIQTWICPFYKVRQADDGSLPTVGNVMKKSSERRIYKYATAS